HTSDGTPVFGRNSVAESIPVGGARRMAVQRGKDTSRCRCLIGRLRCRGNSLYDVVAWYNHTSKQIVWNYHRVQQFGCGNRGAGGAGRGKRIFLQQQPERTTTIGC